MTKHFYKVAAQALSEYLGDLYIRQESVGD